MTKLLLEGDMAECARHVPLARKQMMVGSAIDTIKTAATASAVSRVNPWKGQIHIKAGSETPVGVYLCLPASDDAPAGWGNPTVDGGGNPINPPLGTVGGTDPTAELTFGQQSHWHIIRRVTLTAGNLDWKGPGDPKKRDVLTFNGPYGRSVVPLQGYFGDIWDYTKVIQVNDAIESHRILSQVRFSSNIWKDGAILVTLAGGVWVLGCGIRKKDDGTKWIRCVAFDSATFVTSLLESPLHSPDEWTTIAEFDNFSATDSWPYPDLPCFVNQSGTQAAILRGHFTKRLKIIYDFENGTQAVTSYTNADCGNYQVVTSGIAYSYYDPDWGMWMWRINSNGSRTINWSTVPGSMENVPVAIDWDGDDIVIASSAGVISGTDTLSWTGWNSGTGTFTSADKYVYTATGTVQTYPLKMGGVTLGQGMYTNSEYHATQHMTSLPAYDRESSSTVSPFSYVYHYLNLRDKVAIYQVINLVASCSLDDEIDGDGVESCHYTTTTHYNQRIEIYNNGDTVVLFSHDLPTTVFGPTPTCTAPGGGAYSCFTLSNPPTDPPGEDPCGWPTGPGQTCPYSVTATYPLSLPRYLCDYSAVGSGNSIMPLKISGGCGRYGLFFSALVDVLKRSSGGVWSFDYTDYFNYFNSGIIDSISQATGAHIRYYPIGVL